MRFVDGEHSGTDFVDLEPWILDGDPFEITVGRAGKLPAPLRLLRRKRRQQHEDDDEGFHGENSKPVALSELSTSGSPKPYSETGNGRVQHLSRRWIADSNTSPASRCLTGTRAIAAVLVHWDFRCERN